MKKASWNKRKAEEFEQTHVCLEYAGIKKIETKGGYKILNYDKSIIGLILNCNKDDIRFLANDDDETRLIKYGQISNITLATESGNYYQTT